MRKGYAQTILLFAVVLVSPTIVPQSAYASDFVTCESRGGYTHCPPRSHRDMRGADVVLYSKLSKASCDQGRSWGVDSRGIWVDKGCRARFQIDYYGDNRSGYRPYDSRNSYDHYQPYDRDYRESDQLRYERERLERERERLEDERRRLAEQNEKSHSQPDVCPAGSRPGRCTDSQRRHGCKDFRTAGGLGCMTG